MATHVTESSRSSVNHQTGEVKSSSSVVRTSTRKEVSNLNILALAITLILIINVMRIIFNADDYQFLGFSTILDILANVPQPGVSINSWLNALNVTSDIPALQLLGDIFLKPIQFMGFIVAGAIQLVTTLAYFIGALLF